MLKRRILIINDGIETCKRIENHLKNIELEVFHATSIQNGIKRLTTQDYTVFIMNVRLCEADGMIRAGVERGICG